MVRTDFAELGAVSANVNDNTTRFAPSRVRPSLRIRQVTGWSCLHLIYSSFFPSYLDSRSFEDQTTWFWPACRRAFGDSISSRAGSVRDPSSTMSTLFGSLGANPAQTTNNPFGPAKPSLFGSSNPGSSINQQTSQQGGLVATNAAQPAQGPQISNCMTGAHSTWLLADRPLTSGNAPGLGAWSLGNQRQPQAQIPCGQQPQQPQSIFGQSIQHKQQQQQQQQHHQPPPPKPNLFAYLSQQPLGGSTVGGNQPQQPSQQNNLARSTSQPVLGGSIFGASQLLPVGPAGSTLGQSQPVQGLGASLWQPGSNVNPRRSTPIMILPMMIP